MVKKAIKLRIVDYYYILSCPPLFCLPPILGTALTMNNPLKLFYCLTSTQPHLRQRGSDIIATPLASFTGIHNLWQLWWGLLHFICSCLWLCNCLCFLGFRWLPGRPLPPPVRTTCVSCCFWWCSPSAGLQLGEEDVPGDPSAFVRTIITYVHGM